MIELDFIQLDGPYFSLGVSRPLQYILYYYWFHECQYITIKVIIADKSRRM